MIKQGVAIVAAAAIGMSLSACGKAGQSAVNENSGSGATGTTKTVASALTFGGPAEFETRSDGLPGVTRIYGATFGKFVVTDTGGPVTVTQLKNNRIQAADLFTTDPSIEANHFVVLKDPKNNFAAENVTPIINKKKATPGVTKILNQLSAKLTTADLREMVRAVQNDHKDPDAVAKSWLQKNSLSDTGNSASGVTLTVGSANFPESEVLALAYADALQAAGAKVSTKLNIGSREKYFPALKSGSLDLFPEYNGVTLHYLDKNATATTTAAVDSALAKALPSNLIALQPAPAQDSDAIVVTKATATKYRLTSIADLAKPLP